MHAKRLDRRGEVSRTGCLMWVDGVSNSSFQEVVFILVCDTKWKQKYFNSIINHVHGYCFLF